MKEKVLALLKDIQADVDYTSSNSLLDDHMLSSLGLLQLISSLNDEFDISIPATDIVPDNFNSVDAIVRLIEKLNG